MLRVIEKKIKTFYQKNPIFFYIIILFIITRLLLTFVGSSSVILLQLDHNIDAGTHYSPHLWLNIWGHWDSGWYSRIIENGYSNIPIYKGQTSLPFFPLYPALAKFFSNLFDSYFNAGLIISNFCLILSAWILYKLVKLDWNEKMAKESIKYLFIFPLAFIYSGFFTESLFLFLSLSAFYLARKQKWWLANLAAWFLVITRPTGILILIPFGIEYLKTCRDNKFKINFNFFSFLLPIISLGLFLFFDYYFFGDWLAFLHAQKYWGHVFHNPISHIIGGITSYTIDGWYNGGFAIITITLILKYLKKIPLSYWSYLAAVTLIPLSSGLQSFPRYLLGAFPLYIILAKISINKPWLGEILMIACCLLQGFFMAIWATGSNLII